VPSIPVLVELFKTGNVEKGTLLITASVLSAAFLFTAEHNFYRMLYFFLTLSTMLLYGITLEAGVAAIIDKYVALLLVSVLVAHASERLWWHVVLRRPFPDRKG